MLDHLPVETRAAVLQELKTGWHKNQVEAVAQKTAMAKGNQQYHKGVNGVGRLRLRVPPASYHYWGQRLGYECWRDQDFLKKFERDNPQLAVKGGATKSQVAFQSQSAVPAGTILDAFGRAAI